MVIKYINIQFFFGRLPYLKIFWLGYQSPFFWAIGTNIGDQSPEVFFWFWGSEQGLYRDVKTSLNTKWIEYYDVSLNQFSAASHSHTCHDSSVTETSLPCMLYAIYILHSQYLALFKFHSKLQFFVSASFHVPVKSLFAGPITSYYHRVNCNNPYFQ